MITDEQNEIAELHDEYFFIFPIDSQIALHNFYVNCVSVSMT